MKTMNAPRCGERNTHRKEKKKMDHLENQNGQDAVRMDGTIKVAFNALLGFMRTELIARGILFLILGLLMMFKPGETLLVISVTIGIFILIDGIVMLISALKYQGNGKVFLLLNAAFFIALGLFSCTAPLAMNIIWVMMIGFWQLFSGIQCIGFRKTAGSSAILSGILSIIAGLVLIMMPVFGLMTMMWIMGLISFVSGISAIVLGVRMKKAAV